MTQQSRDRWICMCPYWVIVKYVTTLNAETNGLANFFWSERRSDS